VNDATTLRSTLGVFTRTYERRINMCSRYVRSPLYAAQHAVSVLLIATFLSFVGNAQITLPVLEDRIAFIERGIYEISISGNWEKLVEMAYLLELYKKDRNIEPGTAGTILRDLEAQYQTAGGSPLLSDIEKVLKMLEVAGKSKGIIPNGPARRAIDLTDKFLPPIRTLIQGDREALAQEHSMASYGFFRDRGRIVLGEIHDFGLDPRTPSSFAPTFNSNFHHVLKAEIGQKADSICANDPPWDSICAVLRDLRPRLDRSRAINEIKTQARIQYELLAGLINENTAMLAEVLANSQSQEWKVAQQRMPLETQHAHDRETPEERAKRRREIDRIKIESARGVISVLSYLAGLGGDEEFKKLSKEIQVVGGAAVNIADAISNYLFTTATKKTTFAASVGLVANIAGAAIPVLNLLISGLSIFGGETQAIVREIAKLRAHLDRRLDLVDQRLIALLKIVTDGFDMVNWNIGRIQGDVHTLKQRLLTLQNELSSAENQILGVIGDLATRDLKSYFDRYVGYANRTGHQMSPSDYADAESYFYIAATNFASDAAATGGNNRPTADADLKQELSKTATHNWGYVNDVIRDNLGLPAYPSRVSNQQYLAMAAGGYSQVAKENPQLAAPFPLYRAEDILKVLREQQEFYRSISRVQTSNGPRANRALIDAITNKYRYKATVVQQLIDVVEADYQANPANRAISGLDLWGSAGQWFDYKLPDSPMTACSDQSMVMSPPSNWVGIFDISKRYQLAEKLGLGKLTICVDKVSWVDEYTVDIPTDLPWGNRFERRTYAKMAVYLSVRYQGKVIASRFAISDKPYRHALIVSDCRREYGLGAPKVICQPPVKSKLYTDPNSRLGLLNRNDQMWEKGLKMKQRFETASQVVQPTSQEKQEREQFLRSVSAEIEKTLRRHQRNVYEQVVAELTEASPLQSAVDELDGSKMLIEAILQIGFARTYATNDVVRGLLKGSDRVPDSDSILGMFVDAIAELKDDRVIPKINIRAIGRSRIELLKVAMTQALNQIDADRSGRHPEPLLAVDVPLTRFEIFINTKTSTGQSDGGSNGDGMTQNRPPAAVTAPVNSTVYASNANDAIVRLAVPISSILTAFRHPSL
jgi:hypothetical protein